MASKLKNRIYSGLIGIALGPIMAFAAGCTFHAVDHQYAKSSVLRATMIPTSLEARSNQEVQAMNLALLVEEKAQYDKLQSRYLFTNSSAILRTTGVAEHYRHDRCMVKKKMRETVALLPPSSVPNDIQALLAKPPRRRN